MTVRANQQRRRFAKNRDTRPAKRDFSKTNERLERHYNTLLQNDLSDAEREAFWTALRRDLPNSFRFCASRSNAITVLKLFEKRYIPDIAAIRMPTVAIRRGQAVEAENATGANPGAEVPETASKEANAKPSPEANAEIDTESNPVADTGANTESIEVNSESNTETNTASPVKFVKPPQAIDWFPRKLAYAMDLPKNFVRHHAPFKRFHRFLVSETAVGNISRQEIVSMIPPLLIDAEPHMAILDMCAAPGSKASQLLEMIHEGEEVRVQQALAKLNAKKESATNAVDASAPESVNEEYGRATGVLIANDSNYKRSHQLMHQLKRLSSPNVIVTNHDATIFPSIRLPKNSAHAPANSTAASPLLKFDRILADVPCSGDGTLRKNSEIWNKWVPGGALGLHATQLRILVRALQLLKVGGRVVYSTCSMHPVENEAVVAAAVNRCGGTAKVRIVDCADRLPGLKRRPGLSSWQVMNKQGQFLSSWDDVPESDEVIRPSMFPPANVDELPLDRCMRFYAMDQDTGSFFVTVLEKVAEVKVAREQTTRFKQAAIDAAAASKKRTAEAAAASKKRTAEEASLQAPTTVKQVKTGAEPVETAAEAVEAESAEATETAEATTEAPTETPASVESLEAPPIVSASESPTDNISADVSDAPDAPDDAPVVEDAPVDIPSAAEDKPGKKEVRYEEPFSLLNGQHPEVQRIWDSYRISPLFPRDRFMVRNPSGEPTKIIYYASSLVRDIIVENDGKGLKVVGAGLRIFQRQDLKGSAKVDCGWRIQADSLPLIQGYVGPERVLELRDREVFRLLLIQMFPSIGGEDWRRYNHIGEHVRDMESGCHILKVALPRGAIEGMPDEEVETMYMPLYKGTVSLNLMLPKEDRSAILLRIFDDQTPLINNTLNKKVAETSADTEAVIEAVDGADNVDVDNADVEEPEVTEAEKEDEVMQSSV